MIKLKLTLTTLTCLTVFAGCSYSYGQCQNQVCIQPVAGQRCWTCGNGYGLYCNVRGRCATECITGSCFGGDADSASCQAAKTVASTQVVELREPHINDLSALESASDNGPSTIPKSAVIVDTERDRPVLLLSTTHGLEKDLFLSGIAKNNSTSPLEAYRVGRLMYPRAPKTAAKVENGPLIVVTGGVKPGAVFAVPGQGVDPNLPRTNELIVFFVSEAKFADGTDWHADTEELKTHYQERLDVEFREQLQK